MDNSKVRTAEQAPDEASPAAEEAPTTIRNQRERRRRRAGDALGAAAAAIGALAAAAVVLRLPRARLGVPFTYGGDVKLALSTIKTVDDTGWYLASDRMGAPFGQRLYDFPSPGDTFNMLELRFLTLFTDNPATVLNVFYLLTFVATATTAFLVLRQLGTTRPIAAAVAVAFCSLPYHFMRGESHLFLSNYWVVPLACLVVLRQAGPRPLLDLSRDGPGSGWREKLLRRPVLGAVAVCVAAGSTGIYYAAFTVILLVAIGAACGIRDRRLGRFLTSLVLASVVIATVVVSVLPSLLHFRHHGSNELVATRAYSETEFYGLKIVNLVLPTGSHRLAPLASLRAEAGASPVPGEGSDTLGIVGTVGFLGLLLLALSRVITPSNPRAKTSATAGELSGLTLVTLLVGTVGGFSAVIAALGFRDLRAWNRISVVLSFLALAAVALAVDRMSRRADAWPGLRRHALRSGVAVALVALAVWDQTTPLMAPPHRELAAQWTADHTFVQGVEEALGDNAEVFQLPHARFPEAGPVVNMADYEHAIGFIHSDTLRWSYGAMRGRPESKWAEVVATQPPAQIVRSLAFVEFDGIWIDRLGYEDAAARVVSELEAALGSGPRMVSPDNRYVVFDIRAVVAAERSRQSPSELAARRTAILHPIEIGWGDGFYYQEESEDATWTWARGNAELILTNRASTAQDVRVRFGADSPGGRANFEVRMPNGERRHMTLSPTRTDLDLPMTLPPGETRIALASDAARVPVATDDRDLRFRVLDATVAPTALLTASGR